ncbi:hypothetical protein FHS82_001404 [Pseudochelatococcus lubricantis]|uniref:Uncharacterized protein n=1 Tax=Pseudochelatococcus lubricantis TaxID=1538102 RepID=A0ABX0UYV5_9HYPH|nr:hypothetical protein [Pseudochelatococcus lubricantis]
MQPPGWRCSLSRYRFKSFMTPAKNLKFMETVIRFTPLSYYSVAGLTSYGAAIVSAAPVFGLVVPVCKAVQK